MYKKQKQPSTEGYSLSDRCKKGRGRGGEGEIRATLTKTKDGTLGHIIWAFVTRTILTLKSFVSDCETLFL